MTRPSSRLAVPTAVLLFATTLAAQADLAARVDAIAARHLQRPGAVGLSVGIARGGTVLLERGYGLADAEFDVPADAATMFRIGSVTKQFTAALVMRAVERGELALADPLSRFVPDFDTGEHVVTVRQLLNHTSGIKSYTDLGPEWQAKWPLELSDAELLGLVAGKPFDFAPGTDWHYNNTGYYLLGMVLAKVHGKPYAQVVVDELSRPLGLTRTRYDSNQELIKNRAQGYSFRRGVLANDEVLGMSQPGAAGGLLSTGGDLVRWSMALGGGKVVQPESLALMCTPTVLPDGKDTGYGFGLMIGEFAGRRCIRHGGGIHGFNSMLLWLPDDDLHVAVVSNGERVPSNRVADDIVYEVLGVERPTAKDLPVPAELLQSICGDWRLEPMGLDARVFERDGKPMLQAQGQGAFRLLWQGEDEFRAEFDAEVRVVFAADRQSFALHQGGGVFRGVRRQ